MDNKEWLILTCPKITGPNLRSHNIPPITPTNTTNNTSQYRMAIYQCTKDTHMEDHKGATEALHRFQVLEGKKRTNTRKNLKLRKKPLVCVTFISRKVKQGWLSQNKQKST